MASRKGNRFSQWWPQKGSSGFFQRTQPPTEPNIKCLVYESGNTLNSHKDFIAHLKEQIPLQEVFTQDACDFILVFCPIVSRAGTDFAAAMRKLQNISDIKPAVLVVLHHTFDPECVVPDSSRAVTRKNMIAVDCLFHEDQGLLQCWKNNESLSTTSKYIKSQKKELHKEVRKQEESVKPDSELRNREKSFENLKLQEGEGALHERVQKLKPKDSQIQEALIQVEEMKEKNMAKSKELQEEGNQLDVLKDCLETTEKTLQMKDKTLEEKDTLLREVKDKLGKTQRALKENKTQLQEKERQLVENAQTLQMKDAALKEKETLLKQIKTELDKTIKEFEDNQRHMEEKNTQLENMNKQLSEKETQLKNTDKELETSKDNLETLGQELQDKKRQLQEMMIRLEQQKTELSEKNKQLEEKESLLTERGTQLMERDKQLQEKDRLLEEKTKQLQEKEQDEQMKDKALEEKDTQFKEEKEQEEGANTGTAELSGTKCHLVLESKSLENKDQQVEVIKRQIGNEHTEQKNNENLTQEKGAPSKDTNTEIENMAKEQLVTNKQSLSEGDAVLMETNETLKKRQMKNETVEEQDKRLSGVKNELGKTTMEVQEVQMKEKESELEKEVNMPPQEQEQKEKEQEQPGDNLARGTDN